MSMNSYNKPPPRQYLIHHGILGQKWGVKNGPPYPLEARNHSASEKKAGWQKSLDKSSGRSDNTKRTKVKQNRAVKIGTNAAVAALSIYGIYKLKQSGKLDPLIERGKQKVKQLLDDDSVKNQKVGSLPRSALNPTRQTTPDRLKSLGHSETIREAVAKVNSSGSNTNCRACSIASILRMRGMDVEASGTVRGGPLREAVESCFKGAKVAEIYSPSKERITNYILKRCGEGSSGILSTEFDFGFGSKGEHAISWAVKNGVVSFFDGQSGSADCSWLLDSLTGAKEAGIARLDHLEINPEGVTKFIKIR